jgi:hypothetical protein
MVLWGNQSTFNGGKWVSRWYTDSELGVDEVGRSDLLEGFCYTKYVAVRISLTTYNGATTVRVNSGQPEYFQWGKWVSRWYTDSELGIDEVGRSDLLEGFCYTKYVAVRISLTTYNGATTVRVSS